MARESTIKVLRSTGSTDPTGLTFGELAYTDANGKLFMGTTAGASLWIGAGITTGGIATNSATLVPTQSAVKSYVDGVVGGGSVVNSFNGTGGAITLTGSGAILNTQSGITNTISVRVATTGVTGVASFNSASFDVTGGAVSIKTGGITNGQLANSSVTVTAGSGLAGGGAVALGGSVTLSNAGVTGVVAGTGIAVSSATGNVTITNTGVQSVNSLTGAVTGIATTAGKLSQFAATTSAELAGVISDETGSGALVFATGPTFATSINTSSASFNLLNTTATSLFIGSAATTGRLFGYTGNLTATQSVTVAGADTGVGVNKTVNIGTGGGLNGSVTVNIGQKPEEGSGTINLLANTAVTGTLTVSSNISAPNIVNSFNGATSAITLTGNGAILNTQSGATNTISVRVATTGVTGVASFNSASFDVTAGDVTIKTGGITNGQLANSSVTVTAGNGLAGGGAVALGGTITVTNAGVTGLVAGTGIAVSSATGNVTISNNGVQTFNGSTGAITLTGNGAILNTQSGGTNTISVRVATTGVTGVASFNSASFDVTGGAVTIKAGGITNGQLANSSVTVSAGGTSTLNLADTLTLTGGSNITLSNTANTVTLGLANDIVIAGNLTVNGTVVTANVDSFIAEDTMFALGTGNSADSLDIGFYGIYTNATQRSYSGLFRDASDSGKYKMYTGLTGAEPTTTVNTGASGYTVATLVVNIDGGTF